MTNDMRVFLKTLCAIFATLAMTTLWLWYTVVMLMRLVFFDFLSLIGLPLWAILYAKLMQTLWRWARTVRNTDSGAVENQVERRQADHEEP